MEIRVPESLARFLDDQVKAGRWPDTQSAVLYAITLLRKEQERPELSAEEADELRRDIDVGIAQADAGDFVEFTADDIIREGRAELAARKRGA